MIKYKNYGFFCLLVLFSSCSVSKKIERPAQNILLTDPAFRNAHTGISIFDTETGKYSYNYQAEKYFVPASNTKLATCYAAMKYLGDSLTGIRYNVVNDSTVEIAPAGDPTFLHRDFKNQPVQTFLKRYHTIQVAYPNFDDFLGNGWSWSDYKEDYMAQRSPFPIYGNVVNISWQNDHSLSFAPAYFKTYSEIKGQLTNGFVVEKPWEKNEFSFTNGHQKIEDVPFRPDEETVNQLLKNIVNGVVEKANSFPGKLNQRIYSQPTDSLLKITMHRSDNFFAEQALLMVSNEMLGIMDDRKIIDTLLKTDFKNLPQKPAWVDGSGLSRYNLFSPKDFVFILNKMKNEFGMDRLKAILPTGGTGTISSYYRADSGFIFAKTGTLNGVVALSGFLYTQKNKLLIFSVLVNNHRSSPATIRKQIEKFIETVRNRN